MSKTPSPAEKITYEAAMDRLEKIVDEMESGKMMLEDLIVRYEEGMKLVGICRERLTSAEKRIEIITRNDAGKPVVKNFDEPAEAAKPTQPQPKGETKNDDVSLF